jgi:hypothetical protein
MARQAEVPRELLTECVVCQDARLIGYDVEADARDQPPAHRCSLAGVLVKAERAELIGELVVLAARGDRDDPVDVVGGTLGRGCLVRDQKPAHASSHEHDAVA